MSKKRKREKESPIWIRKTNNRLRKRLVLLLCIVVSAFTILCGRITYLNAKQGNQYKKQVLSQSQQKYGSAVIPFKRGDIKDRNGAVLATSEKVYKIILDCKVVNYREEYKEPTVDAMVKILHLNEEEVLDRLEDEKTKESQYQIMALDVPITTKKAFEDYVNYVEIKGKSEKELTKEEKEERKRRNNIKGIWFEDDYRRVYPMNSMACHLIGFTYAGNTADWGVEGYYSSVLNGTNGRQYGYFNEDASVEQTIIQPVNGNSVVTTIDVNIQQIVEKYIQLFMDGMANGPKGKKGAENIGVIVMDPNNGQILAMASDEPFNLNDPRNLEPFYTPEQIEEMNDTQMFKKLNEIWKNYCISDAFEPGSTVKPLTIAGALNSHSITEQAKFECNGYEMYGDTRLRCSIYPGAHGMLDLKGIVQHSCNDGMMQIAMKMGAEEFLKYQSIFNFGYKTGIDLPGEASGIIHDMDKLSKRSTELASASFGQGYTCTMIQEAAAIASVINGGNYYKPYVVSKILDENGNVKQTNNPVVQKQTVSAEVSAHIREYMGAVCEKGGTGYAAKVDGYSMGGKTGTAEKYPRGNHKYLVSYIGFAPLDNPQVLVYAVVDEPNADYQADSKYAQYIAKGVMTELLPYMNIFQDQELTNSPHKDMAYLEDIIAQRAEKFRNQPGEEKEGADDPNLPQPPEEEGELDLNNKLDDQGILNEDSDIKSDE